MTSLLNSDFELAHETRNSRQEFLPKHTLHPRDNFVAGRVGGFIEVYNTGADVRLEVPLERCAAIGNGREVTSANEHCISQLILFFKICRLRSYNCYNS